jgi:hypothetical protein
MLDHAGAKINNDVNGKILKFFNQVLINLPQTVAFESWTKLLA